MAPSPLIDDTDDISRGDVGLMFALRLMEMQFDNLALAFARVDRRAADAAIALCEHDVAAQLTQIRDKFVEGRGADDILIQIAKRCRETIRGARDKVAQATNHN